MNLYIFLTRLDGTVVDGSTASSNRVPNTHT